ncbi:CPBP family intramembrane metalloprotease [Naumannella sp. ID2617S]|nr:CPBP family intramembrane metalloprotease [Naumannella sp. ID2617S]
MPRPVPLPVEESAYHHFLRTPAFAFWQPIVAILVGAAVWLGASLIGSIPMITEIAAGRMKPEDLTAGKILMTPWVLLGTNLSLAAMIPIALFGQWAFFRQRPRWIHSVVGRFRWGWLGISLALLIPLWFGVLTVQGLLGGAGLTEDTTGGPSARWQLYLAIILITTPLQCAGEEYGFRGLVNRGVAGFFRSDKAGLVAGTLVSSALFAFAHGSTDLWANSFYFGLGVVLALLAWRTGGLEASIALHTVNNLISFLAAVYYGQIDEPMQMSGVTGDWTMIIAPLLGLVVVAILELVRRTLKIQRTGAPGRELIAAQPSMQPVTPPPAAYGPGPSPHPPQPGVPPPPHHPGPPGPLGGPPPGP